MFFNLVFNNYFTFNYMILNIVCTILCYNIVKVKDTEIDVIIYYGGLLYVSN